MTKASAISETDGEKTYQQLARMTTFPLSLTTTSIPYFPPFMRYVASTLNL